MVKIYNTNAIVQSLYSNFYVYKVKSETLKIKFYFDFTRKTKSTQKFLKINEKQEEMQKDDLIIIIIIIIITNDKIVYKLCLRIVIYLPSPSLHNLENVVNVRTLFLKIISSSILLVSSVTTFKCLMSR